MTNNTKCHFEINVIFAKKNIQIKININHDNEGACAQVRSTFEIKRIKYIQITIKKLMTNDTKCHFLETNDILTNKKAKTIINKNDYNRDESAQACSTHKIKKNENIEIKQNKII